MIELKIEEGPRPKDVFLVFLFAPFFYCFAVRNPSRVNSSHSGPVFRSSCYDKIVVRMFDLRDNV